VRFLTFLARFELGLSLKLLRTHQQNPLIGVFGLVGNVTGSAKIINNVYDFPQATKNLKPFLKI